MKEHIILAASLRDWGQGFQLTSGDKKRHLLGSHTVGTFQCKISHVVSDAITSTWVKQLMPGSLSSPPLRCCAHEDMETKCKVVRRDSINDNMPEILHPFP